VKEQITEFEFPLDSPVDRVRDFCLETFGKELENADAAWIASFIADYVRWAEENPGQNALRVGALKLLPILNEIDLVMSYSPVTRTRWMPIAFALGLPSACETNQTLEALRRHKTKQNITNQVSRFLRRVNLPRAFNGSGGALAFYA
jgi:hypothetical protein